MAQLAVALPEPPEDQNNQNHNKKPRTTALLEILLTCPVSTSEVGRYVRSYSPHIIMYPTPKGAQHE